ncbi:MAG: DUF4388 domain-containing protein [Deltaproteobacteria bacterium]|nr:DUF4388 domain-containing protein [Deltaproteobacteria bacterium]
MDARRNSERVMLPTLLLKLHHDEMTGVVTVKDDRRALRIYLNRGHVVYADGVDKDTQLLQEIGAKRKLDEGLMEELKDVKDKDPQSLGRVLIERKLISQSVWGRFLEIKVKSVLNAALVMDSADLGFSKTDLRIPPINFIDCNMVQLLLDSIRGIRNMETLKRLIPEDGIVFAHAPQAEELKAGFPLSPSEHSILSVIDGHRTVEEIAETTGMDRENIYRLLYLLLSLGLIEKASGGRNKGGGEPDYSEIINLYLDLLHILETNFRKEVGKEFENLFRKCKSELTGQSKDLFHDLDLTKEIQKQISDEISRRFASQGASAEGRLSLLSSFNKLIYTLIMKMKKVLGKGLAEKTLVEMMSILEYVEKYREDAETMNYVRGNLKDYLQQIKS